MDEDAPLAQQPLDKKPMAKAREETINPLPFLGLLLVAAVAIALAIGYGNYIYSAESPVAPAPVANTALR